MDCLKSFTIAVTGNSNFTGTNVKTWTAGAQEYWEVSDNITSYFDIQGFKNINIFGLDVIGGITTLVGATNGGCVVEDWRVRVDLDGQIPIIGGVIDLVPDDWSIQLNTSIARQFNMSRYSNSAKFASPYQSVNRVGLIGIEANGYGGQTVGNINLRWDLSFIFYYKFEGE